MSNTQDKRFFMMICPTCGLPSTDKDLAVMNGLNAFDKDYNPVMCPRCDQGSLSKDWVESEL